MKSGENVSALARELDIKRTRLYKWKSEQQAKVHSVDQAASACSVESDSIYENKLATLRLQIADLERLIGRQTIDILFFKTALRRLEEIRQKNSHNGVISSIRKSER